MDENLIKWLLVGGAGLGLTYFVLMNRAIKYAQANIQTAQLTQKWEASLIRDTELPAGYLSTAWGYAWDVKADGIRVMVVDLWGTRSLAANVIVPL